MTRYLYNSLLLVSCVTFVFSATFDTSIGKCDFYMEGPYDIAKFKTYIKGRADALVNQFGHIEKSKFYIKVVKDPQLLYEKFPDWASGIAIGDRIIIDYSKLSTQAKVFQIIAHELCHVYQYRIPNSRSFKSWFKEGMAMHFAKEFSANGRKSIFSPRLVDYYIELGHLSNISKIKNPNQVHSAYRESLIAYSAILRKYGKKSIKEIIQKMKNNHSFEEAFQVVAGISIIDFESEMNEEIKNSNKASIFSRFSSFILFLASIIIFFIFIYIRRRNMKIIKKWEIEEEIEEMNSKLNEEIDSEEKINSE